MKVKYDDYLDGDMSKKKIFEAGQQSQQAKIDLLEKELIETQDFLNKQNHIKQAKIDELQAKAQMCRDEKTHAISRWSALCKERDELQGRIDALVPLLENCGYLGWVNILKGNKDEN